MATFQILKAECKKCGHEYMFLGLCVCAECWAWSADYQSLTSLCLLTETVCLEIFIKFTVIQVWKYNVSLFFFSRTLFLEVFHLAFWEREVLLIVIFQICLLLCFFFLLEIKMRLNFLVFPSSSASAL